MPRITGVGGWGNREKGKSTATNTVSRIDTKKTLVKRKGRDNKLYNQIYIELLTKERN